MGKINKKTNAILLVVLLVLMLFTIWTYKARPIEVKTMEVEFSVGSTTGVNVDTDKIYFGRITPGGTSQRTISIENGYSFPITINTYATKEIAPYIYLEDEYIAQPGKTTKIPITLKIPEDMQYGNYTGRIKFDLKKT